MYCTNVLCFKNKIRNKSLHDESMKGSRKGQILTEQKETSKNHLYLQSRIKY